MLIERVHPVAVLEPDAKDADQYESRAPKAKATRLTFRK